MPVLEAMALRSFVGSLSLGLMILISTTREGISSFFAAAPDFCRRPTSSARAVRT